MRIFKRVDFMGLLVFLLVTAFAFAFFNFKGTEDANVWFRWANQTAEKGLIGGYKSALSDYPPLSFAILDVTMRGSPHIGLTTTMGLKLTLFVALVLTALVFYAHTRDLFLAALLQLSLVVNSMAMVYLDVWTAPFLIAAFWALHRRNLLLFTLLFSVATLIKWQPLVLASFLLLYVLGIRHWREFRAVPWRGLLLYAAAPTALISLVAVAVFGTPVISSLLLALSDPFLSAQALNFNWIVNYLLNIFDPSTYGALVNGVPSLVKTRDGFLSMLTVPLFWSILLFVLYKWFRAAKTYTNLLLFALLGYATYFTFGSSAHENHLFIGVILASILAWLDTRYRVVFFIVALVFNSNMILFYGLNGRALPFSRVVGGFDTSILIALIDVLLYVALFVYVLWMRQDAEADMEDAAGSILMVETRAEAGRPAPES